MDNGIYIAASKQMAMFRNMNVIAANIANMDTTGFQSEHMVFDKYLVNDRVGSDMNFVNDISTYRNTQQGAVKVTDNPLDFAINGNGYFVVRTPLGDRYTRAGNFKVDENNVLVTVEGYQVLDQSNQPIAFDDNISNLVIGSTGIISVDGEEFATIGVVEFDNPQLMERHGARIYSSEATPTVSQTSEVLQGSLEISNVQGVEELTHMIKVSKSTASTAKFIEVMYDLQRRNTQTWTRQG